MSRNIILAWQNHADAASVTTDSEKASLPVTNVQHPHVARAWHTGEGVKSASIILDMGSSVACAVMALLGTNLTPAATVQILASDSDPAVESDLELDTDALSAGAKTGYGAVYKAFTEATARYWRIAIADDALPDNLQIGRLFLGPYWQPSINMELDWSVTAEDPSIGSESWGGQEFFDERPQRRVLQFALGFLSEAEMYTNAFAMARAAGRVRQVLAIPDIDGDYLSEQAVFGRLRASEPIVNPQLGLFRQRFTVRESL